VENSKREEVQANKKMIRGEINNHNKGRKEIEGNRTSLRWETSEGDEHKPVNIKKEHESKKVD